MSAIQDLLRQNIRSLKPYSSARDEFIGKAGVFLDANENPFDNGVNRYPDPTQTAVRQALGNIKGIAPEKIFPGNGSDEVLDIVYRAFCEPQQDNIVTHSPTYGMYAVLANIHNVELRTGVMTKDFRLDISTLAEKTDSQTKLLILCSPNNPSGNNLDSSVIEQLLESFPGIVLIDEAYADFSTQPSWLERLEEFPRLIIMQTLSKAWGAAGIRLGMAFASAEIISALNTIKPPYNVNDVTARKALSLLSDTALFQKHVAIILREKKRVALGLEKLSFVEQVFPSDANFLLVRFSDARQIYKYLAENGVVVRDRTKEKLCEQCLRITIGTPKENDRLLTLLTRFNIEPV